MKRIEFVDMIYFVVGQAIGALSGYTLLQLLIALQWPELAAKIVAGIDYLLITALTLLAIRHISCKREP